MARVSWFSEQGDDMMFQDYVERMESWQKAMADGTITPEEFKEQADRVTGLMREVEKVLSDEQHTQLTEALMEWAVLQGMSSTLILQQMQANTAPQTESPA